MRRSPTDSGFRTEIITDGLDASIPADESAHGSETAACPDASYVIDAGGSRLSTCFRTGAESPSR